MADLRKLRRAADRAVLEQLLKHGDDLSVPRDTVVYFYLHGGERRASEEVLGALGADLEARGFTVRRAAVHDGVIGNADRAVDPVSLDALIGDMLELAETHDVDFDGWECAMISKPGALH